MDRSVEIVGSYVSPKGYAVAESLSERIVVGTASPLRLAGLGLVLLVSFGAAGFPPQVLLPVLGVTLALGGWLVHRSFFSRLEASGRYVPVEAVRAVLGEDPVERIMLRELDAEQKERLAQLVVETGSIYRYGLPYPSGRVYELEQSVREMVDHY